MKLLIKPFMPMYYLLVIYNNEDLDYRNPHMEKLRMLIRDYVALGEGGKVATELKTMYDGGAFKEMEQLIKRISDYEISDAVRLQAYRQNLKDVVYGDTYKMLYKAYTAYRKYQCVLSEIECYILNKEH